MKIKISIIASSIALLIGATSCADWLDVRPEGEILLPEFWQSESDAQSVMAACYRGMIEDAYIERIFAYGEMRSDNVAVGNSTGEAIEDVLLQELEPTHAYTKWTCFYNVINMCNTFLVYAPIAQTRDENFKLETLHSMEAEVIAIRALSYFYLVRAFDKVPYITTASIDDTQDFLVPQTDQEDVLDSLIVDLKFALRTAPRIHKDNQSTKGRITKNAIYALLADIYLWKGDYTNCITECNRILADNSLKLNEAADFYSSVFNQGNSTETIFELQFDDRYQKNNTASTMFGDRDNSGSLEFPVELYSVPSSYVGQYSPFNFKNESTDDVRILDFIQPKDGTYKIFKYIGSKRTDNPILDEYLFRTTTPNWIIYRLADVILMKAEAIIQRDKNTSEILTASVAEAVTLVNRTYLRSNPTSDTLKSSDYPSYMDAEELVLRERQRELLFEGKRYFDLVRMARRSNSTTAVMGYVGKSKTIQKLSMNMATINSLYWPINEEELTVNTVLLQNEFYKTSKSSQ